jgi:hypothetical protein
MTLHFLFGAGASAGSLDCIPHVPPLGNGADGLFSKLRARGVAATLEDDLAAAFVQDFEGGMARFRDAYPAKLIEFQRDIARYFGQFSPGPDNVYRKLIRVVTASRRPVTFSTLNYDMLFEQAVNAEGGEITYPGLPGSQVGVPLFKLHGSCNFWLDIAPQTFQNIGFILGPGNTAIEAPLKTVSASEVVPMCDRENSITPAIAVYDKDKSILMGAEALKPHQRLWRAPLSRATSVYVIGVRVNEVDVHIWEPLARCQANLYYVAPDGKQFLDWAGKHRKRKRAHYHLARFFDESVKLLARKLGIRRSVS